MAANTAPIFSRLGDVSTDGSTGMAQANAASAADYTGISANYKLAFTADATNGGFVQRLRFKAVSTNVAAVARIFLNNGSTNTSAANNAFYGEISLPATTAATATATVDIDYDLNLMLPAGFRIYWGLGAAVANGWVCVAIGGKY